MSVFGGVHLKTAREHTSKMEVDPNAASRDEHAAEAERHHRVMRGGCRASHHDAPFQKPPKAMVAEMGKRTAFFLSGFSWSEGVSQHLSPSALAQGRKLDCKAHCQVKLGSRAQVRLETDDTLTVRRPTGGMETHESEDQESHRSPGQ